MPAQPLETVHVRLELADVERVDALATRTALRKRGTVLRELVRLGLERVSRDGPGALIGPEEQSDAA